MTRARQIRIGNKPRALDKIRQRRAAALGRAVLLGLTDVPDVVLARMVEHGDSGVTMPPGAVLLEVWGGKPIPVLEAVHQHAPAGVMVLTIHHAVAGRLQRAIAWWRWTLYRVRRAFRRG